MGQLYATHAAALDLPPAVLLEVLYSGNRVLLLRLFLAYGRNRRYLHAGPWLLVAVFACFVPYQLSTIRDFGKLVVVDRKRILHGGAPAETAYRLPTTIGGLIQCYISLPRRT